jgi:protein gp37
MVDQVVAAAKYAGIGDGGIYDIKEPWAWGESKALPYPFGFAPTFHRYRLGEPAEVKKPQNIFVCSMADLFGDFIPDEWIQAVLEACGAAPWHNYLFLTKNPKRYRQLQSKGELPFEHWYGTTVVTQADCDKNGYFSHSDYRTFLSLEPLCGAIDFNKRPQQVLPDWVILGAMT